MPAAPDPEQAPAGLFTGQGLKAQLLRGGIGSVAVKLGSTVLTFLSAVILARTLGPAGYGVYAYVFALIAILAVPAQFGLPGLVVRETAKAQATRDWPLMSGLWRWTNTVAGTVSLALAAVAGLAAWALASRFAASELTTFAWGLLLVPLIVLGDLRGAALRGLHRVVAGQLPDMILRPGLLMLFVVAAVLVLPPGRLTAAYAMGLHALAAFVAFVGGALILRAARPAEVRAAKMRTYARSAWRQSVLPLAIMSGMQLIIQYTDILMLGLFRSADQVGIYRVVIQGGVLVVFGLQAVNMVVAPHFARLYRLGDTATLQRVATAGARASLLTALPVVLAFVFFGDFILRSVFGEPFAAGRTALAIIAVGQLVNAGVGSVGFLLNMTGHERDTARGMAVGALSNVVLNLVLIPPLGMNGAALATAVSMIIWNLLLWYFARRRLGIRTHGLAFGPADAGGDD
jgi:O-antigen/teichoic acid export membrane protein